MSISDGGLKATATTRNETGFWASWRRFSEKSHALDYFGLALLITAYLLVKFFGEPFHSQFRLDDPRIQHPHAEVERVDIIWLFIYAALVPLLCLIAWALTLRPSVHKTHVTLLGLVISVILTLLLTDIFKDAIGRPRPDLIARCKPKPGTPKDHPITVDVCTEKRHHVLDDGWRSYPSGHSSFAFSGLGWLALLLASQLHVLRPRANLATVILCMAPLVGAAMIAISRLEDYRHDVFDVVSGSTLGLAIAYFNWRRYYPSLLSRNCDEPYPPTANSIATEAGFQRVRDEEEGESSYVRVYGAPQAAEDRY
ncbi:diacylglycerol pyrophosphate phosphatase 1 [Lecanosticta acicola]|uniref:Diacylglycerol pyrophosphate phosphatase 1 n=1 Tax=Lecanosticta acicola TaxID=111012 RepID=A0AAI8Z509_9PEZI|nr:diacylglycerol pyrophosphate phosphatase 1 [Lecanosticta acicola]